MRISKLIIVDFDHIFTISSPSFSIFQLFFCFIIFSFYHHHQSIAENKEMNTNKCGDVCTVCESGKIGRGRLFCEACLSFYKRNKNRRDLVCKAGDKEFRCLEKLNRVAKQPTTTNLINFQIDNEQAKYNRTTRTGLVRRFLCPACRIAKCQQMVSNDNGNSTSSSSTSSSSSTDIDTFNKMQDYPVEYSDIYQVRMSLEGNEEMDMFQTIQIAAGNFLDSINQMPSRNCSLYFHNYNEAYAFYSQTVILTLITTMKKFASHFDFYQKLQVDDRTKLFLDRRMSMVAGEGVVRPNGHTVASFSKQNFDNLCTIFPKSTTFYFKSLDTLVGKTWNFFQSMKFTQEEIAFFLTILFFNGNKKIIIVPFFCLIFLLIS